MFCERFFVKNIWIMAKSDVTTFVYLADTFIQSNLQYMEGKHFISMRAPWKNNLLPCWCFTLPVELQGRYNTIYKLHNANVFLINTPLTFELHTLTLITLTLCQVELSWKLSGHQKMVLLLRVTRAIYVKWNHCTECIRKMRTWKDVICI